MSITTKTTHHGGCPHDCPDTCSMVFEVEDGKLTGVKGNPDHPMTRGGLCVKLKDYEKRHYHPDRLLYPMRRIGAKGSKQFERITWDEALDEIVSRWKGIIAEHGAEAIVPYSYLGNQGLVHGLNGGDAFFNRMGATVTERTFCGEGSCTAWLLTVGATAGVDPHAAFTLKQLEPKQNLVTLLSGPDGGFTQAEREIAKVAGFIPVSLGKRILRTETAALAALAAVQLLWGDFA